MKKLWKDEIQGKNNSFAPTTGVRYFREPVWALPGKQGRSTSEDTEMEVTDKLYQAKRRSRQMDQKN